RFGSQFYVPNAPSWGLDNRTVARARLSAAERALTEHGTE
ncbi:glutamine synthetase, partial [Pseudomonas aeruginosa]